MIFFKSISRRNMTIFEFKYGLSLRSLQSLQKTWKKTSTSFSREVDGGTFSHSPNLCIFAHSRYFAHFRPLTLSLPLPLFFFLFTCFSSQIPLFPSSNGVLTLWFGLFILHSYHLSFIYSHFLSFVYPIFSFFLQKITNNYLKYGIFESGISIIYQVKI